MRLLELRCSLLVVRMRLLELACIMLNFRMALPVCIRMVGETAGIVHAAEATVTKPRIGASIGKTAVTEAGTAAVETAAAMKAAEATPVELATAVKAAEPATECDRAIDADNEAKRHRRACQQHGRQPVPVQNPSGH